MNPKNRDILRDDLLPGESIVWNRRKGTSFWIVCCGFALPLTLVSLFPAFPELMDETSSMIFIIATIIAMLIVGNAYRNTRRTRYYLTTERIVETRSGNIVKQISLDQFAGRSLSQFLESRVTHTVNNRPVITLTIYAPETEDIMQLKGLDEHSVESFEQIGNRVECPYCGYDNSAMSRVCKNCDAVL
ncbi:MAG: hypothetical protein ACFFEV_07000 [Candidatus Thorarchaeota archaeon]